jgi:hypothetical protein
LLFQLTDSFGKKTPGTSCSTVLRYNNCVSLRGLKKTLSIKRLLFPRL